MLIGGIQKLSLSDYPGKTSAVLFTIGCNMRCKYCHNPELVLPDRYTEKISLDEAYEFLEGKRGKLDGIVVSGGEPTLHKDLPEFLKHLKDLGYLVKLDSNGTRPDILRMIIKDELVDFIAMDIKGPLNKYAEISRRVDEKAIRDSIDTIMKSGLDYEFRTTIVRSQLSMEDFEEIGKIIEGADRYAAQKFVPGKTLDPKMSNEEPYSNEEMENIRKIMQKYVKDCVVH